MKRVSLFFLISILFICAGFNRPHKFYTSIAQMEYNEKTQSWEIIMNVFFDDYEKALSEYYSRKIKIDDKTIDALSSNYLKYRLAFKEEEKSLKYDYIGAELERDVYKVYLELKQKRVKDITINNRVILDVIDEQINIFNIKYKDQRSTLVFTKTKEEQRYHIGIK